MNQNNSIKNIYFRYQVLIVGVSIILVTVALYYQTKHFGFINYDDDIYVYQNNNIKTELTAESIKWALTASYEASWQPSVWLSYLIEYQFHGLDPGLCHLTNVFFHIISAIFLFLVLKQMTGAIYRCAFVALMFALHPIHVESVVWITERKDVLCTFFWILTIWIYVCFTKKPTLYRYFPIILFLCLGLMAKPIPVTLPFVLIILDFWPLNRFNFEIANSSHKHNKPAINKHWFCKENFFLYNCLTLRHSIYVFIRKNVHLIIEKIPFFFLVTLSVIITLFVSKEGGAVSSLQVFPLSMRIENALFSYICYMGKIVWPFNLAIHYPHPGTLALWKVAVAIIILLGLSIYSMKMIKSKPWFFVGWFWYTGTLVPVIGIVQIGSYAMADRFAYIPFIGIYIIIAWSISVCLAKLKQRKILSALILSYLTIISIVTWNQIQYWNNSLTLFRHTLNVTHNNAIAHNNLGIALKESGDIDKALIHFATALRIDSKFFIAHNNIGIAFADKGEVDKAIHHYTKAINLNPDFAEAHNNLGIMLYHSKKLKKAVIHFQYALTRMPDSSNVQQNLTIALKTQKKIDIAIEKIKSDLRNEPDNPLFYYQLGNMYRKKGEDSKAIIYYKKSLHLKPDFKPAVDAVYSIKKLNQDTCDPLRKKGYSARQTR